MSSFDIRVDADEDEDFDPKFNFSADSRLKYRLKQSPLFAYDYLNLDKIPNYSFHHADFDKEDYKKYFSQVKKFSQIKLGELMDDYKRSDHFALSSSPNKTENDLLNSILGRKLKPEQCPPIGHFHLYTPKELAEGQKAPRIHFFLGRFGIFYILFYDPFHTIHPFKKH